jgi:hypothetical protein
VKYKTTTQACQCDQGVLKGTDAHFRFAWFALKSTFFWQHVVSGNPILVICASDDPEQLAPGSLELYFSWLMAGKPARLHMYARGGHGFGMKEQGLPSDNWIQRFYDWAIAEGITTTLP